MEDYEVKLVAALNEMSACLSGRDAQWSEMWRDAFDKAQQLFKNDSNARSKYDFVTRVKSYYGGMGSFNDIEIPAECDQLKTDLYKLIKDARRQYWKQLGFEWHDSTKFQILANGTKVRLIPGKVFHQDSEQYKSIAPEDTQDYGEVWEVVQYDGPDITNMPSYAIRSASHFMTARQDALEIVSKKKTFLGRLLSRIGVRN